MTEEHPELAGYVPYQGKPLRSGKRTLLLRLVVIVGVAALVLPGFFTIVNVGTSNAERACAYRSAIIDSTLRPSPRFELFGPGGIGWECYAFDRSGDEHHIDSMGLIPVAPPLRAPQVPAQNT